ncbi:TPA: Eco57I restriction-modification methylase domain-containing protein [Legionella pneumophila]
MEQNLTFKTAHVVDILGNVVGRDQQIMTLERACNLVSLLDFHHLIDEEVVFFDPFCKAGEILLACAFLSCWNRNKQSHGLLQLEDIKEELYESGRYFGLSPDERHHRLSLRTFLGNTNSHSDKYSEIIRNGNYLSEIDGRFDEIKFKQEFYNMLDYINSGSEPKKIIAVGNPPYQESDGGFGKSAKSIYNYFVESLVDSQIIREIILVIPARWFAGGKGLDEFRAKMINSGRIKNLRYFKNSSDVFPTVDINGGICFFHYVKDHIGLTVFSDDKYSVNLNLNEFDIIADDPLAYTIIRKVKGIWKNKYVGDKAWARNPFGIATNYFNKNQLKNDQIVPCLARGRKIQYIGADSIKKNRDKVNLWKVAIPKAAGGSKGNRRSTIPINQIFIVESGVITTETYNIIDTFREREEALNLINYLQTDFARYLVGLRKITQDLTKDRWNWVPYVDISIKWTDDDLFALFQLTPEEQTHIKKKVAEWS